MPKFMVQASYTVEGAKGLLRDGGSKRRATIEKMVAGLGGKVEAFYYAVGPTDVVTIVDLPDTASAAAVGIAIGASGAVKATTTMLLTPEEIDDAVKKPITYTRPGA